MSQVECYKNIFNQEYSQLNSRLLSLYLLSFVRAFYNARIFIKFSFFFRLISSLQFCFFTVSSPAFLECLLCLTNAILGDVCTFPLSSTHIIYMSDFYATPTLLGLSIHHPMSMMTMTYPRASLHMVPWSLLAISWY